VDIDDDRLKVYEALGKLLSVGDFDPYNYYEVVQHLKTKEIRSIGMKMIAIGEVLDQPACDCCFDDFDYTESAD
jgi:hypothetical protein